MLTDIPGFTAFHVVLSLLALTIGIVAVADLFSAGLPRFWTRLFLTLAALVSLTGFMFPFEGVTPAFGTGIVASIILSAVFANHYFGRYAGKVYAGGIVASVYLMVFVTIAQIFDKTTVLAQTPLSQPAFAITQLATLVSFVVLGKRATRLR